MHLLITPEWDTDGKSLKACCLPRLVLMLDAPARIGPAQQEVISDALSDAFGFCHNGWTWERFTEVASTHAGGGYFPDALGVCRYPACPR